MGILTQVCILSGNEKKAICTLSLCHSINLYTSHFNFVTKMPKEGEKKYRVQKYRKDWEKEEWARGWLSGVASPEKLVVLKFGNEAAEGN